ncbi:MAG TPA: FtsX-like permease family protein [Lacibacter sp.]|nr:FtsX-like permease family protein [Lacibacter sp.]HMO88022.1 FtsX-like permease family protein [Lacibacter sp.]
MNLIFAWRYFRSKKSTNAINIIAWVTVTAMAVGTAALIIVLSIFNGFEGLVKELYSSFYPDVRITAVQTGYLTLDSNRLEQLRKHPAVGSLSLVAEVNAHLQYQDYRTNAVLKGVDDSYTAVTGVRSYITRGSYATGTADAPELVLGMGIEQSLNLLSDRSLDLVTVYLPRRGVPLSANPLDAISTMNFRPRGAFAIQQDFDNKYVLTNLEVVRELVGLGATDYSAAEIRLRPGFSEKEALQQFRQIAGPGALVENRYQQNRSLFAVMQLEKWAIYGILSLILVIAAFNMIGALTMLVLEKQQDIQILKAMGAPDSLVRRIFLTEGVLLALVGGGLGMLAALLFCYLQVQWKIIPLEGSFVIDYYPVKVLSTDLLLVTATVLFIAVLAAWVPSRKAAAAAISLKSR